MSKFNLDSKVVFVKDGKDVVGVVGIVGHSVVGVYVDGVYEVVATEDLVLATPARLAGFKVGDKGRITEAGDGFKVGTIVTLFRDDGTVSPLWEGPNDRYLNVYDDVRGRLEGAFTAISFVEKVVEEGPTKGVLWTDAPEGATHYSLSSDHAEKWHKREDGDWFFYVSHSCKWHVYFEDEYAYVESQVAIPGVKVVVAPVVVAPTPAPALDFSKWEKGDVVRATSDDSYDISVGHFYILTEDESRGWLKFRDDDNYPRTRHIENYELVLKRNK